MATSKSMLLVSFILRDWIAPKSIFSNSICSLDIVFKCNYNYASLSFCWRLLLQHTLVDLQLIHGFLANLYNAIKILFSVNFHRTYFVSNVVNSAATHFIVSWVWCVLFYIKSFYKFTGVEVLRKQVCFSLRGIRSFESKITILQSNWGHLYNYSDSSRVCVRCIWLAVLLAVISHAYLSADLCQYKRFIAPTLTSPISVVK